MAIAGVGCCTGELTPGLASLGDPGAGTIAVRGGRGCNSGDVICRLEPGGSGPMGISAISFGMGGLDAIGMCAASGPAGAVESCRGESGTGAVETGAGGRVASAAVGLAALEPAALELAPDDFAAVGSGVVNSTAFESAVLDSAASNSGAATRHGRNPR